jgi:gliding motility-associated-like protein
VLVYPYPTASFTYSPQNPLNQTILFTNLSKSNFNQVDDSLFFNWLFGDGSQSHLMNPQYQYAQTGSYLVYLEATNKAGCMDTMSTMISETIIPKVDMPKAFTPNGDGLNDVVAPRAFGVVALDFRIYNRWGQEVYHSNDPSITYLDHAGWDGTFQGKPQPMDAYAYSLHVTFSDGKQATKQGSITLIR